MSAADLQNLVIGALTGVGASTVFVLLLFIGFCVLVGFTKTKKTAGGNARVELAVRAGPTVRLRIRLDDGRSVDALVVSLEHPRPGDRVDVAIDPAGILRLR